MVLKTQNFKFSPCGRFSQIASQLCSSVLVGSMYLIKFVLQVVKYVQCEVAYLTKSSSNM